MEMAYSGLSVSLFRTKSSEVSRPQTLSLGYFDEAKNAKQIFTFFSASQKLVFTPFERILAKILGPLPFFNYVLFRGVIH